MIGLAKGFICDGTLNDVECSSLREWLMCNSAVLDTRPASRLGDRLLKAFEDGVVDDAERKELAAILLSVAKLA
jgi:hypothetical protein